MNVDVITLNSCCDLMKTAIAIFFLALLQIACYSVTYYHKPTFYFGAYYIIWMLASATFAALVFAPRFHFVAATANAIIAAVLFNYLFLHHGYFWPEQPKEWRVLAMGYFAFGIGFAGIVAGFVHAILARLKNELDSTRTTRILIAMQKGFAFSTICAIVIFVILAMLAPPNMVETGWLIHIMISTCVILLGTIVSAAVGLTCPPPYTDKTNA